MKPCSLFTAALVWVSAVPVWAQTPLISGTVEHSGMHLAPAQAESPTSATMDHGSMNMQGGPAPADARDPHAYSDGLTLESGPYALPGPRQLRLSDEHRFGAVLVDRLERVHTKEGNATTYDAQAWFGGTYDRLVLKAEGDVANGKLEEASTELLWGHAISAYWDSQLGVRLDSGTGPDRTWLAFGFQGLAPYWFEVDATAYLGTSGQTSLRLSSEYELLVTQRWIVQPRLEANVYGETEENRGIGSGLSDLVVGIRLRYEFNRQFAPYIGIEWAGKYGKTASFARREGLDTRQTRFVAGLRVWF
ncbi:copper resistance protein B [Hydrogenophilus thermoluteolus]|uniref:copper resistance protein B n=1 Tax=Hydrogenophilus thermoluteolus TaxID=297 RepID=UPI002554FAC3|nr:copper resistance protein B [Hydrogenophilus thermoluteolus]